MHITNLFKCRHKGKFKLFWLRATEAPTQDKNQDIDFELILFYSVINSIKWREGIYVGKEIFGILEIIFTIRIFEFLQWIVPFDHFWVNVNIDINPDHVSKRHTGST